MSIIFNFFIFPGLLFSATVAFIISWIDRKITARLQYRKGPIWYQNFIDFVKLLSKEIVIPQQAGLLFVISPYIAVLAANTVSTILGLSLLNRGFWADLIVVVYLLVIPSLAIILGASSSGNPLAAVGVSREMKSILAYEFCLVLSLLVVVIKSAGSIRLEQIIEYQNNFGSHIWSFSGFLAFLVCIFCMLAKLGFVPFDTSEAEQEIMGGVLIEYSGILLGLFKLAKSILFYITPIFLIILFWAKNLTLISLVIRYLVILFILIVIKNTNPRLKIDQVLKFFWGFLALVAIFALFLAIKGL